jgi:hypothetical protein
MYSGSLVVNGYILFFQLTKAGCKRNWKVCLYKPVPYRYYTELKELKRRFAWVLIIEFLYYI